jgi:hypothetical protein
MFYQISRPLQQKIEFITVRKLYFWNLRSIIFLPISYSCIKRQSMMIYKADYSGCIIEKDVKVNIMRFRTLRSIEFQGLCSRNWNLSRSENCIVESTVHKLSTNDLLVYQKTVHDDIQSRLFRVHNRKRRES